MSRLFYRPFSGSTTVRIVEVKKFNTINFEQFGPLSAGHHFSYGKYHDPNRMGHGLLRLFDDGIISSKATLPEHPHKNIDIISVVLPENMHPFTKKVEGGSALVHGDSKGNKESIAPGSAQVMSVGSDGIIHSEKAPDSEKSANFFQIWLRQTKKQKVSHYGTRKLPLSEPQKWVLLASGLPEDGDVTSAPADGGEVVGEGCVPLKSPSRISSVLLKPGQKAPKYYLNNRFGYIVASSGSIEVNGINLEAHDAAQVSQEQVVDIKAIGDIDSQIVLVDTVDKS